MKKKDLHNRLLARSAVMALLLLAAPTAGRSQDYTIGTDDLLHISVWDYKELDHLIPVRPDGKISFPLVGEVQAAGLTVPQLTETLTERLASAVKAPQVSVVVKEIRSFRVYFVGRVAKPGVYPIKAGTPLLQALTLAGGLLDGADLPAAYIVRGEQKIPVDLRRLIHEADLNQNLLLRTDDTVVVPEVVAGINPQEILERRIYLLGKVQKPGVYTLRKEVPILHALFLAGGLADGGDLTSAFIVRGDGRLPVNLRQLIQKGDLSQNLMVQHEDVIVVPEGGEIQNAVFIMGEVQKQGVYPRTEALSILKLVALAGGFTKYAASGRATLIRENGDKSKTLIKLDLDDIMRYPAAKEDVSLMPGDVVIIPQRLF
ncbi:MAG: SLBB domain-containing protein [candidate division NC10 bacterium]|nr:SLBB domain-containing protein [candidate division NC10 bacterium]